MMTERQLLNLLLRLLARTTPHGYERKLAGYLPKGGYWDAADNYIVEVGAGSETLFCCHMDTVGQKQYKTKPVMQQGIIHAVNKNAPCLGGDDKCGVLCMTAMIAAGVPGVYIFHAGEECGGIGASEIAEVMDLTRFKQAVEFDRRGRTSVITSMGWIDTCSDEFAWELCERLGMGFTPDPTGTFTDVLEYAHIIPEVTNISVGYADAHSAKEIIDAAWLIAELIPRLYQVDWEALPVKRDPAAAYAWEAPLYYRTGALPLYQPDEDWWCCDICGYPVIADGVEVLELDGYCYHVCPECVEYFERCRV